MGTKYILSKLNIGHFELYFLPRTVQETEL